MHLNMAFFKVISDNIVKAQKLVYVTEIKNYN